MGSFISIFSINERQVVMGKNGEVRMENSRYNLLIQLKIHSFDAQQSLSLNDKRIVLPVKYYLLDERHEKWHMTRDDCPKS